MQDVNIIWWLILYIQSNLNIIFTLKSQEYSHREMLVWLILIYIIGFYIMWVERAHKAGPLPFHVYRNRRAHDTIYQDWVCYEYLIFFKRALLKWCIVNIKVGLYKCLSNCPLSRREPRRSVFTVQRIAVIIEIRGHAKEVDYYLSNCSQAGLSVTVAKFYYFSVWLVMCVNCGGSRLFNWLSQTHTHPHLLKAQTILPCPSCSASDQLFSHFHAITMQSKCHFIHFSGNILLTWPVC